MLVLPVNHPTVEHRKQLCAQCPQMFRSWVGARCHLCGCIIAAKTRLTFTKCPAGKW